MIWLKLWLQTMGGRWGGRPLTVYWRQGGDTPLPTWLPNESISETDPLVHCLHQRAPASEDLECLCFTCKWMRPRKHFLLLLLSVFGLSLYNLPIWCPESSKMTFQFSLWDKFKELSSLPSSTFNNLAQLVTHFLQKKCLSLSILKVGSYKLYPSAVLNWTMITMSPFSYLGDRVWRIR